ncbi:MAG: hypothetical protein U0984_07990, partial [Prosthecobacter sp.]|nr:hypothetical protein [Prosthecobacter sp.]
FTGGDGFDTVGFNGNCAVGGAATLRMGAGNDLVYNSATRLGFGAGLLLDGGTGHDEFVLGGSSGGQVRIIGNLNCIAGTGEDTLSIGTTSSIFSATGSVMMSDAGGNDVMTIAGTRFSAGALVLQLGSGDNSLTTTVTDLFLVRNLQWQSTSGADNVFIGGGNLRVGTNVVIALGTGNDTALVNSSSSIYVGGLVTMTAAATVGVNRSLVLESSDVMVTGKVTLTGGAGDGFMRVAGSGSNYLGGGVALSCGLGQTNLRVSSNGSLICNGALSLTHGGGSGSLEVFDFGAGDSLINGAVTMKGGSFLSLNLAGVVTGAVNLATSPAAVNPPIIFAESSGADGTHFAGSVRASVPTLAGQVGTIRFAGAIFEGAATFLGGAGTDTLRLNNIDAEKALTASLGAGDDRFEFEQTDIAGPSLYHGAVLLQGGAGADVFLIGGDTAARAIDFRKAVTADGGTGSDTLTVGTQVTFAPGFPLVQKNIP